MKRPQHHKNCPCEFCSQIRADYKLHLAATQALNVMDELPNDKKIESVRNELRKALKNSSIE